MAYCTKEEIGAEFKSVIVFSDSTNVTAAAVNGYIAEADALINSYVGKRYSTPVATGEGVTLLKLISRSICVARVKLQMEVVQAKSADANQNVRSVLFSPSKCIEILEDIQKGNVDLIGATSLLSSGAFFNNNVDNEADPVIEKHTKQW